MTWQIQSWPTPEIFIARHGTFVFDRAHSALSLISAYIPTPHSVNAGADNAQSAFSLLSVDNPPLIGRVVSDAARSGFSILAVLAYAKDTRNAGADNARAGYSLKSVLQFTPDTRITSPEPAQAAYSLLSCNSV